MHHHDNAIAALVFILSVLACSSQIWPPIEAQPISPVPNEILRIELPRMNLDKHITTRYQVNSPTSLVLRRGKLVEAILHLGRPFNTTTDKLRLELNFFRTTKPVGSFSDGSLIYAPILPEYDFNNNWTSLNRPPIDRLKFEARIKSVSDDGLLLQIEFNLTPNMPVGTWILRVSSKIASQQLAPEERNQQIVYTLTARELLYIIFNSWNRDDDVYLSRDDARNEYLLNEVGKIYIGSYAYSAGRKWTYGQFDSSVLPTLFYLLDRTRLSTSDRSSPVQVSRAVSAIVNSHNDDGLLAGNWSGSYDDGHAPWQWNDSPAIFRRYIENGYHTVKFGQCWVFGGVTTTSLRALGIPARAISNFVSAHDTDSSLTVDKFYSELGSELTGVNGDSIWNFHVWSDAWMRRPDLPNGYSGWQAIDATPQEPSMGIYQLGPASLEAIKRGKVGYAYDVAFVFSEVNANVVYWRFDGRSRLQWRKSKIQAGHMGRKILTKMIGVFDDFSRSGALDAENIVDQYKYPSGSIESDRALAEAMKAAGLQALFER